MTLFAIRPLRPLRTVALAACCVAFAAGSVHAATPIFSLEGQTVGEAPTVGVSQGTVVVDDGSFSGALPSLFGGVTRQLLLDTQGATGGYNLRGSYGGTLPGATQSYSVFQLNFAAQPTTSYSFAYNLLTNATAGSQADFLLVGLRTTAGTQVLVNADTRFDTFSSSASGFARETGIRTVTFDVPDSTTNFLEIIVGTNQAGCAIGGAGGVCIPTAALIGAVPEPGSWALFAVGASLLGMAVRRRRRALG